MNLLKTAIAAACLVMPLTFGAARADVHIALVGPQTGQYASFFDQMQRGAQLAVSDLNTAGGLMGQKVVLDVQDDACDPKQAVSVANRLAGEHVLAVIGHFCSSSSIPASEIYADADILMITPASTNPALTEKGAKTVFRVCGRDDQQADVAAKQIIDRKLGSKIAFVDDHSTYGAELVAGVKKRLAAAGVTPKFEGSITQGDKDFSAVVTKLKALDIDLIFYGGYQAEAGLLVRQAREQGLKAKLMGGDGLANKDLAAIAGASSDGVLFTFYPDPRENARSADLVQRFRTTGFEPEGFTLYTYAAAQVVAEAVKRANASSGSALATAIRSKPVDTVLGSLSFDAKGDPNSEPFVLYAFEHGNYAYVK